MIKEKNPEVNEEKDIAHDEGLFDPELSQKIELRGHRWRQQGPYIICRSCDMRHAHYIGIDRMLMGINEEGYPMFSKKS